VFVSNPIKFIIPLFSKKCKLARHFSFVKLTMEGSFFGGFCVKNADFSENSSNRLKK